MSFAGTLDRAAVVRAAELHWLTAGLDSPSNRFVVEMSEGQAEEGHDVTVVAQA